MMPGPQLPDPNTEQGKSQLAFSMLTCAQQIDSKIFAYMKHIRPRRALIIDEQKQTVGTFPLFVHDGTRRGAPPDAPPGMLQNLVTMETFSVRGGQIHHVEAAPFVTHPLRPGQWLDAGGGAVKVQSSKSKVESKLKVATNCTSCQLTFDFELCTFNFLQCIPEPPESSLTRSPSTALASPNSIHVRSEK